MNWYFMGLGLIGGCCLLGLAQSLWMLRRNGQVFRLRQGLLREATAGDPEFWNLMRERDQVSYQDMMRLRDMFKPVESYYEGTAVLARYKTRQASQLALKGE